MTTPVGPYSPIVRAGEWLVCSGQVGLAEGALVAGGVEAEARQALANLSALLEGEGASLAAVVKTTVFLTDLADFPGMNAVYARYVGDEKPARSTIEAKLAGPGMKVEVDLVVGIPD